MKNTIKHLLIAALFSAVLPAQAAVQNYTFDGAIDSGIYLGQSFSGSFSFDDATVDNFGSDVVSLLSFNMSFLNTGWTLANATGYPTVEPDVSFQDGSFLGLSISFDTSEVGFSIIPGFSNEFDSFITTATPQGLEAGSGNVVYSQTAAIPEADTYAMLLAGLGVMGAVARRRKSA